MSDSKVFVDNYLPALLGQAWMLVSSEFHAIVEKKGYRYWSGGCYQH